MTFHRPNLSDMADPLLQPKGLMKKCVPAFFELVHLAKTDGVVIIEEVQHAQGSEDGDNRLLAARSGPR